MLRQSGELLALEQSPLVDRGKAVGKLVVLNLVGGDIDNGCAVSMQIFREGDRSWIGDARGKLPSFMAIQQYYDYWQTHYLARFAPLKLRSTRVGARKVPNASLSKIRHANQQLKSQFRGWIDAPEMFAIEREILRNLKDESEEIRFVLQTDNIELQKLPWHNWHIFREYCNAELSLYLPVGNNQLYQPRDTVKVLAVFGRKEILGTNTQLRTEEDLKALQKHLAENSNAQLISLEEPTLEELCEAIDRESPQILFFAGHSSSEDANSIGIIELNREESITIDDLAPEIRDAVQRGLQLAIFNSCEGLGIAKQLASLQVPNIIVMREPVGDEVAQKFLQRFLEAFAAGKPLHIAMRKAREKINRLETKFPGATGLPIVFQNPARPPLTWQSLGGKKIDCETTPKVLTEELDSIQWLPTQIKTTLSDHTQIDESTKVVDPSRSLISGRYKIIDRLRKTVFCETFIAQDTQLPGNPRCIVKKLQIQSHEEFVIATAKRLFHNEALILHRLDRCPLIPRLLAHFEVAGELYLVQEFIDGKDLSQSEIFPGNCLSESEVRNLLKEVLKILAFVHQNQVIHRDIKPSNLIRRASDNKIVLVDFGSIKEIAHLANSEAKDNSLTVAIGTLGYMASEQQRGDPRFNSDIYGLGITAIQALTGLHPERLPKDVQTGEVSWRDRALNCSDGFADLLDRMVRNNFKERYQNVDEVLRDLEQLQPPVQPPKKSLAIVTSDQFKNTRFNLKKIIAFGIGAIAMSWGALMMFNLEFNFYRFPVHESSTR